MNDTAKERRGASGIGPDHVSYLTVGPEADGQRLDNFLLRLAKGVPQSHVYRIVRSGQVRVNKARASVDQRLAEGDQVRVPPLRLAAQMPPPARAQMPPVLFEDEHLIAVDKPAGLAAHGGSGIAHGLIEMVRAARPNQPFLELAHRLDRDTSGILLLAKTRRALLGLHEQLREGQVDKRYLAAVRGWPPRSGTIDHPLRRLVDGKDTPRPGAIVQEARTEFRLAAQAEVERRERPQRFHRHRRDVRPEGHGRGAVGLRQERTVHVPLERGGRKLRDVVLRPLAAEQVFIQAIARRRHELQSRLADLSQHAQRNSDRLSVTSHVRE